MFSSGPDTLGMESDDSWTPWQGIRRAVIWGGLVALLLAAGMAPLAWYVPYVVLNAWLRLAFAFGFTCLLFSLVHRKAGMAGGVCTLIVLVYVFLILFSQHLVFSIHGVPTSKGIVIGWQWCHPTVLLLVNWVPLLGVFLGVVLCHDGGAVSRTVVDILRTPVR